LLLSTSQKYIFDWKEVKQSKISVAQMIVGCYSGKFELRGIYARVYPSAIPLMLGGSTSILTHL
jgi:hypothetical protein